jgi:hypothetical protein
MDIVCPGICWAKALLVVAHSQPSAATVIAHAWQRAFVFRFPLATLAAGTSLGYNWWTTTSNGSLRLTQGAGATMHFGSHNSATQMRVFDWPDASTNVSWRDVNVHSWSGGPYSSGPAAGGINWLGRVDSRITGAWVGAGQIGFMWTASPDSSHAFPYIRVVRVNESTKALVDEPDIWSTRGAWAYPAAAPNSAGLVGISAFYGGGTNHHPGHVVGVRRATAWDTALTATSTNDPATPAFRTELYQTPSPPVDVRNLSRPGRATRGC